MEADRLKSMKRETRRRKTGLRTERNKEEVVCLRKESQDPDHVIQTRRKFKLHKPYQLAILIVHILQVFNHGLNEVPGIPFAAKMQSSFALGPAMSLGAGSRRAVPRFSS